MKLQSLFLWCGILFLFSFGVAAAEVSGDVVTLDFEQDLSPDFCTLQFGAALTAEPQKVISGKQSLAVDAEKNNEEWNEFLLIGPGLFKPETSYRISFDYRWKDGKAEGSSVYCLLRSKTKNANNRPDLGFYSKTANEFIGMAGKIQRVIKTNAFDDYYLIVGVTNKGAVSIDNLQIREGERLVNSRSDAGVHKPVVAGPPPHAQWQPWPEISDEFDGNRLDPAKWKPCSTFWIGRPPAYFDPRNVTVRDGELQLTIRNADYANDSGLNIPRERNKTKPEKERFHTWTSATVEGLSDIRYGYFEIRAKVANASCSSAFWFTGKDGTEIDVFEIGGNSVNYETLIHSTVHVFPKEWNNMAKHWMRSSMWDCSDRLADAYHLYGLEWDDQFITFYFDGELVGRQKNTHWHFPLKLLFDIETFPSWLGVPTPGDRLPAIFHIEYFRAWRKAKSK